MTSRVRWVCDPLQLRPSQEYRCVCALAGFEERWRLIKQGIDLETAMNLNWTFSGLPAPERAGEDAVGQLFL